jgi:hypothetical protein
MLKDYFNETEFVGSTGITLHELLEYYRTLCEQ